MKTIKNLALVMGIIAMNGLITPVLAADAPAAAPAAVTFGVVDMNKVLQTTDAAKDIFNQLEGKRKEYQAQISKEEDSLRSAEQEIMKQKDTLSKEEFEKKRTGFEEKVLGGQKLVQDRKHILDQAFNNSMGNLRNEAAKIVAEIAKEKSYSAVFTQDAIMISDPKLDMTDVVVDRMNRSVKKMPIDWTASAAASESDAKSAKKK
jgi:outer membrane protein